MMKNINPVRKIKLFKEVKTFYCLFCEKEYPLTDTTFKYMNKHGWGCCRICWVLGLPNLKAK